MVKKSEYDSTVIGFSYVILMLVTFIIHLIIYSVSKQKISRRVNLMLTFDFIAFIIYFSQNDISSSPKLFLFNISSIILRYNNGIFKDLDNLCLFNVLDYFGN